MVYEVNRRAPSWLTVLVSRALDAGEREVVLGDLQETREIGFRALRQVGGLVVRRQAALWTEWRPWFVLLTVAMPLGFVMSLVSRTWADATAINYWTFAGHWDARYHDAPREAFAIGTRALIGYLALAGWAWVAGFTIRSWSPRTAWVNAVVAGLYVYAGTMGNTTIFGVNNNGLGGLDTWAALVLLPALVKAVAVILPAWSALRHAERRAPLRPVWSLLCLAALVGVTWESLGGMYHAIGLAGPTRVLPLLFMWPTAYVAALALRTRRLSSN